MPTSLATLARNQQGRERKAARHVAQVAQWLEDGYNVPQTLKDAARITPAVLALPGKLERMEQLIADYMGELHY